MNTQLRNPPNINFCSSDPREERRTRERERTEICLHLKEIYEVEITLLELLLHSQLSFILAASNKTAAYKYPQHNRCWKDQLLKRNLKPPTSLESIHRKTKSRSNFTIWTNQFRERIKGPLFLGPVEKIHILAIRTEINSNCPHLCSLPMNLNGNLINPETGKTWDFVRNIHSGLEKNGSSQTPRVREIRSALYNNTTQIDISSYLYIKLYSFRWGSLPDLDKEKWIIFRHATKFYRKPVESWHYFKGRIFIVK